MGSRSDLFISLSEAANILERSPEEVNNLCNEGLIRRRSTGEKVLVHVEDVRDVRETNLHNIARPRELVKKVLLLEREVAALRKTVDLMGKVNGFLSSSLEDFDDSSLLQLSNVISTFFDQETYTIEELLKFSEIFLRVSDADIVRLNDIVGTHNTWRDFYKLCLKMTIFSREGDLEMCKDLEIAQALLARGLRNVRSIGVLFIENEAFLKTSRELLEEAMGHDLAGFDMLIKKLKKDEQNGDVKPFLQNF